MDRRKTGRPVEVAIRFGPTGRGAGPLPRPAGREAGARAPARKDRR